MSNEMIVPNMGVAKFADDKTFTEVASGNFLPRLQLFGGNSEAVKESKIGMAHYGIVRDKSLTDLGKEPAILILSWRPKALEIKDGQVTSIFDPKSPEFKRIAAASELPDSGCMYGPEFLVYVPQEKVFCTFLMGSKTARRAAPEVKALMGRAATLKSQFIKTPKYSWHGPVVTICSTTFELPPETEMREVVQKFNNPPESEEEAVPE